MRNCYVLYDNRYPYLPIDVLDSPFEIAVKYSMPIKTVYNAIYSHRFTHLGFHIYTVAGV